MSPRSKPSPRRPRQERSKASLERPLPDEFAPRFFAIAEQHPEDPAALDALCWVASKCIFGPHAEKAMGMIARDHGRSAGLKDFCGECSRYGVPFSPYEEMLRAVLKDSPHRQVKGAACLALADYLKMAKETTESRLVKIALSGEESLDKAKLAKVQRMKDRDLEAVAAESEALFQQVIDQYADIWIESNSPENAAELAKGELHALRHLCIGQMAPEIVGKDIRGKPMRLADYRGKVVVLEFGSHRSCGVCRQFDPLLRMLVENYRDKPFALLGVSVDDDVKELVALADKGENTWPIWWDGEHEGAARRAMGGPVHADVLRARPEGRDPQPGVHPVWRDRCHRGDASQGDESVQAVRTSLNAGRRQGLANYLVFFLSQWRYTSPGTRLNSPLLCVTSVQPFARAIAAIIKSLAPIIVPIAARWARLRA